VIYRIETNTPTGEIAQKLTEAAKTEGFGVLQTLELPPLLKSKGFDYSGDVTVYEICNPGYANSVICEDPAASVYLPCRVSVAKVGDRTVVSTNDLEAMMQHDALTPETVRVQLTDVFTKIKKIMELL